MYPKGIALTMEPASAATVAKVDQISRTLQFTWGKVPKDKVRITAKKSDESGATLNGKKIRESVAPPAAAAGAAGMKKRGKPKKSAQANGDDSKKESKKDEKDEKSQPNGDAKVRSPPSASVRRLSRGADLIRQAAAGAGAVAGGALGAVGGLFAKAAGPAAPGRASTREDGKLPSNALIIINNDLYITRTQFFAFVAFGLLAYYIGKVTA